MVLCHIRINVINCITNGYFQTNTQIPGKLDTRALYVTEKLIIKIKDFVVRGVPLVISYARVKCFYIEDIFEKHYNMIILF